MNLQNVEILPVADSEDVIIRGFNPTTGKEEAYRVTGLTLIGDYDPGSIVTPIGSEGYTITFDTTLQGPAK